MGTFATQTLPVKWGKCTPRQVYLLRVYLCVLLVLFTKYVTLISHEKCFQQLHYQHVKAIDLCHDKPSVLNVFLSVLLGDLEIWEMSLRRDSLPEVL